VKLRDHRGLFEESMQTVREIEPTKAALVADMEVALAPYNFTVDHEAVHVTPYVQDIRNGWDTYIVYIDNYGVFGYVDGPIEE
jgi:hypothetical protein